MSGVVAKLLVSAVIVVFALPGLVVEPGPLSEMVAIGLLAAVWLGDMSAEEAAQEATGGTI